MATKGSDINDLFLTLIDDYKITTLYQTSGSAVLTTYLESWLLYSINEFKDYCVQELSYSTVSQEFSVDLTQENMLILAQIMVKYWLMKEVQNVNQMSLHIQDHDFKTYSEAENLKEKRNLLNNKKEEISQILIDYGYKNNTWSDWFSQNFSGA